MTKCGFSWLGLSLSALGAIAAVSGCSAPRLDDARLLSVSLASAEDSERLKQAWERQNRENFGGATVHDPQRGTLTFPANQYEAYRKYLEDHRPPQINRPPTDWPVLRIVFASQRRLIETTIGYATVYFCSSDGPLHDFLDHPDVMWRGQLLTLALAQEIDATRQDGTKPQQYEILAAYTYARDMLPGDKTLTILPPRDDLCLAMVAASFLETPRIGDPLRIEREAAAAALGPLPRSIALQ